MAKSKHIVLAERVFKDMCNSFKGFNYTEYDDGAVFDVNTDNFLVTFRLGSDGMIQVTKDVTDYSVDRDYGEEKVMW